MKPNLKDLQVKRREMLPLIPPRKYGKGGIRTHLVIPDTQTRPDAPYDQLGWAGRYIMDRKPDVIVHLGDHWDLPSCSSHDEPVALAAAGHNLRDDLEVGKRAMDLLLAPLRAHNAKRRKGKQYNPRRVFLLANHENRMTRKESADPTIRGLAGSDPFGLDAGGWEVVPYLVPIVIDGIAYSHFFSRGPSGRITQSKNGAPNALTMVKREMRSCTAGHLQGLDLAPYHAGGGRTFWGLIAGSFYLYQQPYIPFEGNMHWHGLVVKHEVHDGTYDPMLVSLDYLRRKYS